MCVDCVVLRSSDVHALKGEKWSQDAKHMAQFNDIEDINSEVNNLPSFKLLA